MALEWNDPDPPFNTVEVDVNDILKEELRRMQMPDLRDIPCREPQQIFEPETTDSWWDEFATTFLKFSKVPEEVRKRIWDFAAANDKRVIEMKHPDFYVFLRDRSQKRKGEGECKVGRKLKEPGAAIKHRALLLACTESRKQQLDCLHAVDVGTLDRCLMNLAVDTIYFGPNSYWFNIVRWRRPPRNAKEAADYKSKDLTRQGWVTRQEWNHWKNGLQNRPWGDESVWDELQFRDQIRNYPDPYHPLLSKESSTVREHIRNVAFDLEFWEETRRRRRGGLRDLMSRFPHVHTLVLATGDTGDGPDPYCYKRSDEGATIPRKDEYKLRLTSHYTTAQFGVFHDGEVGFLPGAFHSPLGNEVLQAVREFQTYPKPVIMCVTRGGEYKGHSSRFIGSLVPPNDNEEETDSGVSDTDPGDDDPSDRKIPQSELSGLLEDLVDTSDQDLQRLRKNLPDKRVAEEFHKNAPVPEDEDIEVEMMDLDENDEEAHKVAKVNSAESLDAMDVDETYHIAGNEMKRIDSGIIMRVDGTKSPEKPKSGNKTKKSPSPKKSPAEKNTPNSTIAAQGETVEEIIESKMHYGHLTYRVRFEGQPTPDKKRYERTEPMFVDNEKCKKLIAQYHLANPGADNIHTEAIKVRKAYGTVTKNGAKILPPSPPSSDGASASSSSIPPNGIVRTSALFVGGESAIKPTPKAGAGLTPSRTPPISPTSSSSSSSLPSSSSASSLSSSSSASSLSTPHSKNGTYMTNHSLPTTQPLSSASEHFASIDNPLSSGPTPYHPYPAKSVSATPLFAAQSQQMSQPGMENSITVDHRLATSAAPSLSERFQRMGWQGQASGEDRMEIDG